MVDGVHIKGSSGMKAYTLRFGNILAAAGLINIKEAAEVGKNLKICKMNKMSESWIQVEGRRGSRQH